MRTQESKKPLIFVHIFRTGGNTLTRIIHREIPRKFWHRMRWGKEYVDEFKTFTKEKIQSIKFIDGHMHFGLHEYISEPCDYITILRDPVERTVSQYYNTMRMLEKPVYKRFKNMTLEEYVTTGADNVTNIQTRVLSNVSAIPKMLKTHSPLSHNAFEFAQKNLKDRFKVVGVTDQFDETLLILKKELGLKNIYYVKRGTGRKKDRNKETSAKAIELIKSNNMKDIELYEYARKLLEEKIRSYGPSFNEDLAQFKRNNKIYARTRNLLNPLHSAISKYTPTQTKRAIKRLCAFINPGWRYE
jgi:hypothetical protein